MADNYLITGYHGTPHVTAENDRGINAATFGAGRFVLPVGKQFKAEYIGNNTVRIYDGKLMDNGAVAGIPAGDYVDISISNAGQNAKRNDLICFQYEKSAATGVESGSFVVVQGTETSGTAADPALTQQDLLSGTATKDQMPLYRVAVSSTTIATPVQLFSVASNIAAAQSTADEAKTDAAGKAPTSHASTGTTYGAGTGSNYGHVKLSDSTSSTSAASAGIAASPKAVKTAYDLADGKVSKAGDAMTGELTAPGFAVKPTNSYPRYELQNSAGVVLGALQASGVTRKVFLIVKSKDTEYVENYFLPLADTGRTADESYNLLTTKTAVTVAQGGTGATTAAAALTNLGAMPKSGGTFTGNVVAYSTNRAGSNLRNINVTDAAGTNNVSTGNIKLVRK